VNIWAEDLKVGNLALAHKTNIEQSQDTQPDARWQGPYHVTDIAQSLTITGLVELAVAEYPGCRVDSQREWFSTAAEPVHSTRELHTPSMTLEQESEESNQFPIQGSSRNEIYRRKMDTLN